MASTTALYRCFNYVEIEQVPTKAHPARNKTISLNFLHSYEVNTGWENLTGTTKIVLPKNVVAKDLQNNPVPLNGSNITIGGGSFPLFLRGDKIRLQAGYWYNNEQGQQVQQVALLFTGYISKVHSKMPITLDCEDESWVLKQLKAPDKVWGNVSVQKVIQDCIAGNKYGLTVSTLSKTEISFNVGTFYTKNETVMQVLARIKRVYKIGAYLKGKEIRIGYPTYYPSDVQNPLRPFQFVFQKNIISDNLEYQRKDDILISCTAESSYVEKVGGSTKDGATKTATKKLMVFIQSDGADSFKSKKITDTSQIPQNEAGERMTFFFPFAKTTSELTQLAENELKKKYYTGFKGSFTTFGIPFIPFGDNIKIVDPVLPDRDGIYKVKAVNYSGGVNKGIRQTIYLDYKIDA